MADLDNIFDIIANPENEYIEQIKKAIDYSNYYNPPSFQINEEDTLPYQLKKHAEQINKKQEEQNALLLEQNKVLRDNNDQLKSLLAAKENELDKEKAETKKAKQYNIIMLIIAVVSAIIAFLAWFFPRDPKHKDNDNNVVITESNTDSPETVLSIEDESSVLSESISETAVNEVVSQ